MAGFLNGRFNNFRSNSLLRFGYSIAHVGLIQTLLIILVGHLVTIPAALAVARTGPQHVDLQHLHLRTLNFEHCIYVSLWIWRLELQHLDLQYLNLQHLDMQHLALNTWI